MTRMEKNIVGKISSRGKAISKCRKVFFGRMSVILCQHVEISAVTPTSLFEHNLFKIWKITKIPHVIFC